MPAATLNLALEQGATYQHQLVWKVSAEGAAIDLTGYTARLQIRKTASSDAVLLSITTENGGIVLGGVLGTINLLMTSALTAALPAKDAVYDLELIRSDGYVFRLVMGAVSVSAEVTR